MTRPLPLVLDLVVALALVALGQVDAWTSDSPSAREAAIAAVATAPLGVRRLAPGVVLGICVLAMSLHTIRGTDEFTVAQLLGLMLATYTVAEQLSRRRALWAGGIVVATGLANSAAAGRTEPGYYAFPVILLGLPWAAGVASRGWRERNVQLRDLTEQLQAERAAHADAAVAAERGRIARDLHDSLAQSLNAMVVHAEAAQAALHVDTTRTATSLSRIQEEGRRSLHETRHLLLALRDHPQTEGLRIADVPALAARARVDGLVVDVEMPGDSDQVPGPVQAAVYRVVQESLTNVAKHSTAGRVSVRIEVGETARVTVSDDGRARGEPGRGLGLRGMRERAGLLGGTMEAGPGPSGYVVRAELPLEQP